jgi:hypothetical protein
VASAWNGWLRALPTRLPMEPDFTPSVIAVDPLERRGKKGCKFLEELQIGNLKRPAVTLRVQLNGPCKNASSHVWPLLHAYAGHSKFTQIFNTIRQKLVTSGKTRIGTTSILYSR